MIHDFFLVISKATVLSNIGHSLLNAGHWFYFFIIGWLCESDNVQHVFTYFLIICYSKEFALQKYIVFAINFRRKYTRFRVFCSVFFTIFFLHVQFRNRPDDVLSINSFRIQFWCAINFMRCNHERITDCPGEMGISNPPWYLVSLISGLLS